MEPARAWRLPDDLGMSRDADLDSTYRWPVIGRRLAAALQDFTAENPEMLARMLATLAPLRSRSASVE
jgi:hypothetical protein